MVGGLCETWYNMWIKYVCGVFPWWESVGWNCFSWAEGFPYFKRSSVEISAKSYMCLYFKLWVVIIFLNELGYHMLCEFLVESEKLGYIQGHAAIATCRPLQVRTWHDPYVFRIFFTWKKYQKNQKNTRKNIMKKKGRKSQKKNHRPRY